LLTSEERAGLIDRLETSRVLLHQATEHLTELQWTFRANPESWSAAEVVEHLCNSEEVVLGRIENQIRTEAPTPDRRAETEGKESLLFKAVPTRTGRAKAPEEMAPRQRFSDGPAALAGFLDARQRTMAFVAATQAPLRDYIYRHFALGRLNSYQWLILLALHAERHSAQIGEIRREPGFP
jgi:hypothetical protein